MSRLGDLRQGRRISCGCLHGDKARTHGQSKSKEYRSWTAMKRRCYNQKSKEFSNYGARGIEVCIRWRHSFERFLSDMGRAPSPRHTIDRINPNGNYERKNCRWATPKQQGETKRTTLRIEVEGKSLTRHEAAEKYRVNYSTIRSRHQAGLTPRQIVGLDPHPVRNYK